MAAKALNLRIDEAEILEMKTAASVMHTTVTDIIKTAVREYLAEIKKDPLYILTANIPEADEEESAEILSEIGKLTPEDLETAATHRIEL